MTETPRAASAPRPGLVGPRLHVFMHGQEIASLVSPRSGTVKLTYLPGAQAVTRGLSCSLPTVGLRFSGEAVNNWLGGLLPDRSEVLVRWRAQYGLRRQDVYALLWHVGEDVPGAARFVRPDRVQAAEAEAGDDVALSEDEIAARITALAADAAGWAPSATTGQFSLAGAQAKFALARVPGGWVEPSGPRPTTHIFKPAIRTMADQDLNEHLTMRLARAAGLRAARTQLVEFAGARALVVERFDRYRDQSGRWQRVHQEDTVQALGMAPSKKYEQHGGPGVRTVAQLVRHNVTRQFVAADVQAFVDAVAFNWLTMGTDAHARNYALLHAGEQTRLAPLYDLNSFLAYTDRPASLAMAIGFRERDPAGVGARDWDELARDCSVDPDATLDRVRAMGARLLDVAPVLLTDDEATRWESGLPRTLQTALERHVTACVERL